MSDKALLLNREWILGDQIHSGGFGKVFAVTSGDQEAVAKLVPKAPGADRELLFVDLDGARNIVPVIDSGETDDSWVLVMPRAEKSLRQYLDGAPDKKLEAGEAVAIMNDVLTALVDIEPVVVHRDIKPDNVLLLNGVWCLADFGISRYASASTSPDTRKHALTPQYAAPEQWRSEHATGAADVYAFGVLAYEMLVGSLPFPGPTWEDFHDQHLHAELPAFGPNPSPLLSMVRACLYKAHGARPSAADLLARLQRVDSGIVSPGVAQLQAADEQEVLRRAESARVASISKSVEASRQELMMAATDSLESVSTHLRETIVSVASTVAISPALGGWSAVLNGAGLTLTGAKRSDTNPWGGQRPLVDVVCHASIAVNLTAPDRYGYQGRSHSLWFCDAKAAGEYGWFETAFMISPLLPERSALAPFALAPGREAAEALWTGLARHQVAWPFEQIVGNGHAFGDRWILWFGAAARGHLGRPSTMPERQTDGTWRRT